MARWHARRPLSVPATDAKLDACVSPRGHDELAAREALEVRNVWC